MLASTLCTGTPIALTATDGLASERSGVVNTSLEGITLTNAFGAVIGNYLTGNSWVGVLFAILADVLIPVIHSMVPIIWGGGQSASSMALVLLVTGSFDMGLESISGQQGSSPQVTSLEHTPILSGIPVIGGLLADLSSFAYVVFIVLVLARCLFKYILLGLRIIIAGGNPRAAEAAGLSVHEVRYFSVISSGVLDGFSGAFLSLG